MRAIGGLVIIGGAIAILAGACGGSGSQQDFAYSALLTLDDLPAEWTVASQFNPIREDARNPSICQGKVEPGARLTAAEARFEHEPFGPFPDSGGHGPFLYNAVIAYPTGGAADYLNRVRLAIESCPDELTRHAEDGRILSTIRWSVAPIVVSDVGDEALAVQRLLSAGQESETNIIFIRRGEIVSIVLHSQLGSSNAEEIETFARVADEKLRQLER